MIPGNTTRLSLIFHIKCSLTFPHVKDIPLGLRSLKTSVTCLFRMEEELPPHACSNLSPAPNILISLSIIAPNGKSRRRNEIDTGASSRLSGVFILLFLAIYNFFLNFKWLILYGIIEKYIFLKIYSNIHAILFLCKFQCKFNIRKNLFWENS